ncbi:MAG: alpha-amylase family glycosyl hydrolase [Fimbriimonas sp.]|nr:alpha-amylase family glycosyl hydrolase [Fimbriimonas sp.]
MLTSQALNRTLRVLVACLGLAGLSIDPAFGDQFDRRMKDPTVGQVVYELWIDRFVPPSNPAHAAKRFAPPRSFHKWSEPPAVLTFDKAAGYWSHELAFWGGDIRGVRTKLDYIRDLGVDTLYLRPVFEAFSSHKYDTSDYFRVAPEFGSKQDLIGLFQDCHKRNMKVVLDGVFNHVGKRFEPFQQAQKGGQHRNWFTFDKKYPNGYLSFAGVPSLPSWNLENPAVRNYLWNGKRSVVRYWLDQGADGWRLDVAYEIGPKYLDELTRSAHREKPQSTVVGEIRGYPSDWFPAVDGAFNFYALTLAKQMVDGKISGREVGQMYEDMVADASYEHLLKSWLLTDNGDTVRLADQVPDLASRKLVEALQFSLPGSPVLYYGTELGMRGANEIACRAPMRWDLVNSRNEDYRWIKTLTSLRRRMPALRVGEFRVLRTNELVAYIRYTNKLKQAVVVVANPTDHPVTESFGTRIGRAMSYATYRDALSGDSLLAVDGILKPTIPPKSVRFYSIVPPTWSPYDPHRRIE